MTSGSQEPNWLTLAQVQMLHAETLRLFGGRPGVRDEALLESAVGRPRNRYLYEDAPTVFELAASYGYGLSKNHAFIDGNKRISLLAVRAFLFRNGYHFRPDRVETVTMIEGLAAGSVTEELLAAWIEKNASPAQP